MAPSQTIAQNITQTIAQNFFLQNRTWSVPLSSFSNMCAVTSQRNFGARSMILERVWFSSLIMTKPCMFTIWQTMMTILSKLNWCNDYMSIFGTLFLKKKRTENCTWESFWMGKQVASALYYILSTKGQSLRDRLTLLNFHGPIVSFNNEFDLWGACHIV
jgi:hypothetical protein